MSYQCFFCHNRTIEKQIERFNLKGADADRLIETTLNLHSGANKLLSNPDKARILYQTLESIVNKGDLYIKEKKEANDILLALYPTLQNAVKKSNNPLKMALKLAVAGNLIDFGPGHSFDIKTHVLELANTELAIDDSTLLFDALKNAKKVLYLGDNAGEIVMDKLFLETLNHPNVTYVVRGKNIINDATLVDANNIGMNKIATTMANGDDSPSTLLNRVSKELFSLYEAADVVISKGMGNFEGLMHEKHNGLYFLLMAKCLPVAEKLGVQKGEIVVSKCV